MDWMGHTIFKHTLTGNGLAVNIWAMCCPKDLGMDRNYARKWEGCQTKEASTSLTIWCVPDIPILSVPAGVWIWTRCNSRLTNQQPSIFGGLNSASFGSETAKTHNFGLVNTPDSWLFKPQIFDANNSGPRLTLTLQVDASFQKMANELSVVELEVGFMHKNWW